MSERVEMDPVILSCAVRYALGRHSYLPGVIAAEVRRCWPHLGEQRSVIRQDIVQWLDQMGTSDYVMGAGWSTSRPTWEPLLRWIDSRNESDVKDACPRCGSTTPSRRFSSDNGRTHCGHGWHFAPLDPEEAEMGADQIHDGPMDGTRLSAEGRPMAEPISDRIRSERQREASERADCPFCAIIAGTAPATIVHKWRDAICIVPLNPVVEGHVLVIPKDHVQTFFSSPDVSVIAMRRAAELVHGVERWVNPHDYNIITSAGRAATQTVMHLHVHLVPRVEGDGLLLPWSDQGAEDRGQTDG